MGKIQSIFDVNVASTDAERRLSVLSLGPGRRVRLAYHSGENRVKTLGIQGRRLLIVWSTVGRREEIVESESKPRFGEKPFADCVVHAMHPESEPRFVWSLIVSCC